MRSVKVRIAVAVTESGDAVGCGFTAEAMKDSPLSPKQLLENWEMLNALDNHAGEATAFLWVDAEVPVPEPVVVKGAVVPGGSS